MDSDVFSGLIFWIIIIIFIVRSKKRKGMMKAAKKPIIPSADNMAQRETISRAESRGNVPQFRMPPAVSKSVAAAQRLREETENYAERYAVNPSNYNTSAQHVSIAQLRAGENRDGMSALIEDRQHDWLARQLRAERRAWKSGEGLLDLGASHDASCDARAVKRLHLLQHDDSIDDGEM